ncbi:uncharacterized protein LOC144677356 [Cetorhinus maximus]
MENRETSILGKIQERLRMRYPSITRLQVMHYTLAARNSYSSGKLAGQSVDSLVQAIFQLIEEELQKPHTPCQETGTSAAQDGYWETLAKWAKFRACVHSAP